MDSSVPLHGARTDAGLSKDGELSEFTETHQPYVPGDPCSPVLGDRYELLREIARGGMGIVFRAHDLAFDRTLAIKIMQPAPGNDAGARRRFMDEAKITGQLQHPGIPPAHEVGRLPDGRPYFSMKLIEGQTLATLLAGRASPQADLPSFLKIFEQIAQTLAFAHAQRVIHRDLKPSNIMVGAFGEVQVMDWGLAKRLRPDGQGAEATPPPHSPKALAAGKEPTIAAGSQSTDDQTRAGAVVGTYSYMAPEQARGDIGAHDERCDVFGLGAILCTILTGIAPYQGESGDERLRQAREADLADAWSRLDVSGADPELVRLAKACLAPKREDRPAHAGRVADDVTRHLASVQARLQEARVAQAQAEVKAQQARLQRRLAVGLAAAVVTLVVGASSVGWWYVNDQARRDREEAKRDAELVARAAYLNREVGAALDEAARQRRELHERLGEPRQAAVLLSELHRWQTLVDAAQAAWKRADTLAAGGGEMLTPALRGRLQAAALELRSDEQDRQVAVELDRIRFEASTPVQNRFNLETAAPKLAQVFRKANLDVAAHDPVEVGTRIRAAVIRLPLVASLDFWALVTQDAKLRARLLTAARTADADPWRDRYRQSETWNDRDHLQALARDVDVTQQSPQLLAALAQRMRHTSVDAAVVLQRALDHHPHDFWLFFELGLAADKPIERLGAYRAALVVRPDSGIAYYVLGNVHLAERKFAEAAACLRHSIELVPDYAGAHNNLGLALDELGKRQEALACHKRAIELDPQGDLSYSNLGAILHQMNRFDEAIPYLKKAVDLDPNRGSSHNNLGAAQRSLGKLDEAVASFRKAVALDANNAFAWCNLGHTLTQQGKFEDGLQAMRRGHDLGSSQAGWQFPSARWVQETEHYLKADRKLDAVLRGDVKPADAQEQLALAQICAKHKQRPAAATRFYTAAFRINPLIALLKTENLYYAACAAAQAADGQGIDAATASAEDRAAFRKQALQWLTADLSARTRLADRRAPAAVGLDQELKNWQTSQELASVRDPASLAKLPPIERETWQKLWADVAALRKRSQEKP